MRHSVSKLYNAWTEINGDSKLKNRKPPSRYYNENDSISRQNHQNMKADE